jgi:hypothetical protein
VVLYAHGFRVSKKIKFKKLLLKKGWKFIVFWAVGEITRKYTVPKMDGKVRVIRHSDHGSSANKPDFSLKNIA